MAEVEQADQRIDNCADDQDDCERCKGGERLGYRGIFSALSRVVDPGELENKVCKSAEVEHDDSVHTRLEFLPREPSCSEQDTHGDGNCRSSQCGFDVGATADDDEKLDSKANEEEEIELQKGNIDL